jgi:hypothetical protein
MAILRWTQETRITWCYIVPGQTTPERLNRE